MIVMLTWAAVHPGSVVITPEGIEALVTGAGEPLGSVREVTLSAARLFRPRRIVDVGGAVPVVFNDKSKAIATLASVFPGLQIISEEAA